MGAWSVLGAGEAWQNPYAPQAVRVCFLAGGSAYIGHSSTLKGAEVECSGYYRSEQRNCASNQRVGTSAACREAARLLEYPFAKDISSSSRVAGCFYDPNGFFYFNQQ